MVSTKVKQLIERIDMLTDKEMSNELKALSPQEREEFEHEVLSVNQNALEKSKKLRERASRLHKIKK